MCAYQQAIRPRFRAWQWVLWLSFIILAACGGAQHQSEQGWVSPLDHTHPLVGKRYKIDTRTSISEAELVAGVRMVPYVLLGEKHDNADHHIAHARLIAALPKPGGIVLEMLRRDQMSSVSRLESEDGFRDASKWDKSGWPDYELYAPLIKAIYEHSIRPSAGSPTRRELIGSMSSGESLRRSLPETSLKRLSKDIDTAHCGHSNEKLNLVMVGAQIFKDQVMAHELRSQAGFEQGILVAGNGHIRKDYGVPMFLKGTVSIAFLEVQKDKLRLSDYEVGPYDYVVFTPRVDDLDPCERFKEQLQKLRKKGAIKH